MSGAGHQKGDVRTRRWLIEDKITSMRSFRITEAMIVKTTMEALAARRLPQWRITIAGHMLRVMREEDYLAFMEELDQN